MRYGHQDFFRVTGRDPARQPLTMMESALLSRLLLEMWRTEVEVSPDPGVTRED